MGQMYNLFGVFLLFVVPLLQMSDEPFLLRRVGKCVLKCGRKREFCRQYTIAPSEGVHCVENCNFAAGISRKDALIL